jgi:hypothetical protein
LSSVFDRYSFYELILAASSCGKKELTSVITGIERAFENQDQFLRLDRGSLEDYVIQQSVSPLGGQLIDLSFLRQIDGVLDFLQQGLQILWGAGLSKLLDLQAECDLMRVFVVRIREKVANKEEVTLDARMIGDENYQRCGCLLFGSKEGLTTRYSGKVDQQIHLMSNLYLVREGGEVRAKEALLEIFRDRANLLWLSQIDRVKRDGFLEKLVARVNELQILGKQEFEAKDWRRIFRETDFYLKNLKNRQWKACFIRFEKSAKKGKDLAVLLADLEKEMGAGPKEIQLKNWKGLEVEQAGLFLRNVFLIKKTRKEELKTIKLISKLVEAVNFGSLKKLVFKSLQASEQEVLWRELGIAEKEKFFGWYDDEERLILFFKKLKKTEQNRILKYWYFKNRKRYESLKEQLVDKVHMVGGILIKQEAALEKMLGKEKAEILDLIYKASVGKEEVLRMSQLKRDTYDVEEQVRLAKELIADFRKSKNVLASKEDFVIYLKFFYFIAGFLEGNTVLQKELTPLLERVILMFKKFPDGAWIIKVLNQLPEMVKGAIMQRLQAYEQIRDFEKREMYCKILNKIKED